MKILSKILIVIVITLSVVGCSYNTTNREYEYILKNKLFDGNDYLKIARICKMTNTKLSTGTVAINQSIEELRHKNLLTYNDRKTYLDLVETIVRKSNSKNLKLILERILVNLVKKNKKIRELKK